MIDAVGGVLKAEYNNEPVQPIHDALIVRGSFAVTARDIIRSQFMETGLYPHVKIEHIVPPKDHECPEVPVSNAWLPEECSASAFAGTVLGQLTC